MEKRFITLAHKPGASLHLSTFFPGPASRGPFADTLVLFLNGLALPRADWVPAITSFLAARQTSGAPVPPILSYDRYGQGDSEPDPSDAPGSPYGHEPPAVVADLHALLVQLCGDAASGLDVPLDRLRLVLVCNSIGCALARMFAAAHPGLVEGVLMLDSMVANTDFVSFFPDPDSPGFDAEKDLVDAVTVEQLCYARAIMAKFFHPTVPNGERLDRRRMAEFLPDAYGPKLPAGPAGKKPALVVVGHDLDEFSRQTETGPMKIPATVSNAYMNPAWAAYNEGLTKLTTEADSTGAGVLKIAKSCGHFIQVDDPAFVAAELDSLLSKVISRRS